MTGYQIVNLRMMIDEIGEDRAKAILSDFMCPLNKDVESFLRTKAIEFSKQGLSQTHLVFTSYKDNPVLVGYFTLANKYIHMSAKYLNSKWRKRINRFSRYDKEMGCYVLPAPLIGQLGKNYNHGYNELITGDELLKLACDKIATIQLDIGGKIAYLECENKPKLKEFYESNGFCCFDTRKLDRDETELMAGEYLLQMLNYIE